MKTIKIFCTLTILSCVILSCQKKTDTPEPYSSYISIEISKPLSLGTDTGKTIQIYIKNDSDKEFEKECILTFALLDTISGGYYYSENKLSNKKIPVLPNGVLNITYKGTVIFNATLSDLIWKNTDFESITPSRYLLTAQLFIRDPYSPENLIYSNRIMVIK
jgi:hypothetical protein